MEVPKHYRVREMCASYLAQKCKVGVAAYSVKVKQIIQEYSGCDYHIIHMRTNVFEILLILIMLIIGKTIRKPCNAKLLFGVGSSTLDELKLM
jgi:hypothetical protein